MRRGGLLGGRHSAIVTVPVCGDRDGVLLTPLRAEEITTPLEQIPQLGGLLRVLDLITARVRPLQGLFDL